MAVAKANPDMAKSALWAFGIPVRRASLFSLAVVLVV